MYTEQITRTTSKISHNPVQLLNNAITLKLCISNIPFYLFNNSYILPGYVLSYETQLVKFWVMINPWSLWPFFYNNLLHNAWDGSGLHMRQLYITKAILGFTKNFWKNEMYIFTYFRLCTVITSLIYLHNCMYVVLVFYCNIYKMYPDNFKLITC